MKKRIYQSVAVLVMALATWGSAALGAEISKIKTNFENTGVDPDAQGTVSALFKGEVGRVKISVKGLTPDTLYFFQVDGQNRAEFTTSSSGTGKLTLSTNPKNNEILLTTDPRGKLLSINDGSANVLQVQFEGDDEPDFIIVYERSDMIATEADPDATGTLFYKSARNGEKTFSIKVGNLTAGDYDLMVGGENHGLLTVGSNGKGKLKFSTTPNGSELPLDFEPRFRNVEVVQDGIVYLTGHRLIDSFFHIAKRDTSLYSISTQSKILSQEGNTGALSFQQQNKWGYHPRLPPIRISNLQYPNF